MPPYRFRNGGHCWLMPKAKTFTLFGREPDRAPSKRAVGTKRLEVVGELASNEYFQPLKLKKLNQADYACL